MIKVKILDNGVEKMILLSESAIVSVEENFPDLYNIYLIDGRILHMTQEMFIEHFEEEENTEYKYQ